MTDLRALTVRRPWCGLIAHHGKDVENRTWSTSYRGRLFIHAGHAASLLLRAAENPK